MSSKRQHYSSFFSIGSFFFIFIYFSCQFFHSCQAIKCFSFFLFNFQHSRSIYIILLQEFCIAIQTWKYFLLNKFFVSMNVGYLGAIVIFSFFVIKCRYDIQCVRLSIFIILFKSVYICFRAAVIAIAHEIMELMESPR